MGLPEEYKQISLLCQEDKKWKLEYEIEVLGITHTELSAEALASGICLDPFSWRSDMDRRPETDPASQSSAMPLSRTLHIADRYVKVSGTSVSLFEDNSGDGQSALEPLQLGDALPAMLEELRTSSRRSNPTSDRSPLQ